MDDSPVPSQKKPLSGMAWLGIGCGGVLVIGVIIVILIAVFAGPQLKQIGQDYLKDPTRATVDLAVKASFGQLEIVAQDEANKRYTLRGKADGKLTTIYWDAKQQKPVTVNGDFSAIPADANPPATPTEPAPK